MTRIVTAAQSTCDQSQLPHGHRGGRPTRSPTYDYMNFNRNDFEVFFSMAQGASNESQVAFPEP